LVTNGIIENGNGNGNGVSLRKLYLLVAVLLSILSFGKSFFFTDTAGARLEERQLETNRRMDRIEQDYVRKDVIEPQLNRMDAVITREEQIVREQTQVLDKLQARSEYLERNKGAH
jgi:hypothetical protein